MAYFSFKKSPYARHAAASHTLLPRLPLNHELLSQRAFLPHCLYTGVPLGRQRFVNECHPFSLLSWCTCRTRPGYREVAAVTRPAVGRPSLDQWWYTQQQSQEQRDGKRKTEDQGRTVVGSAAEVVTVQASVDRTATIVTPCAVSGTAAPIWSLSSMTPSHKR